MKLQKSSFCIVLLLVCNSLFAQYNVDSLKTKSYDDLSNLYSKTIKDEQRVFIANFYINKAKDEKNIYHRIAGYHLMAIMYSSSEKTLIYADSMLQFSLKSRDNFHSAAAIKLKGDYYYKEKDYKKALDSYLQAKEYAQNEFINNEINYSLGLIKTRIGKHRDALTLHKEILTFKKKVYEERKGQKNRPPIEWVLSSKYAIANSYKDLALLDSAYYFNKIGLREAEEIKVINLYHLFLLNQGTVNYLNKTYKNAIDSLKITEKYFKSKKDPLNYAETSYYLGASYLKINKNKEAIFYFKKVDSVFNITNDVLPIIRNSYEHLIKHYKDEDDLENQLKYLLQLKKLDSILVSNNYYINTKLIREYDLPLILDETRRINSLLEKKQQTLSAIIITISLLLIGVIYVLVFQYRRRKLYKARFNEIVNNEIQSSDNELEKNIEELTMSKEIIAQILTSLEDFEKSKRYISSEITLQNLAQEFNTNTNYLSKVINHYKKESFSKYITKLRILFTINELKTNPTFRKYTIVAIAKEAGFNNSESFSKAFYSKTGIKPSYFIKELEKRKD